MAWDIESRLVELRFLPGIEKVEHVPYTTGDQLWVTFSQPLDLKKLRNIVAKHGYDLIKFGGLFTHIPRRLSEILWDGVTHVVAKKLRGVEKFRKGLGYEPEGIAKIAISLHSSSQIFIASNEEALQILYEYLGLKYVPPPPPPQPPKPAVLPAAKPAPRPPQAPAESKPPSPAPTPTPAPQPKPATQPSPSPAPSTPSTTPQSEKETSPEKSA